MGNSEDQHKIKVENEPEQMSAPNEKDYLDRKLESDKKSQNRDEELVKQQQERED